MTDEKNDETTSDGVPVSNIGYAAVPEGFVFVPTEGGTGDRELLKKLFDAVENPEDVITRPGYGYLIPESAAGGFETVDVVTVVDESTPDSTPAASALDTQEDAGVQDNVGDTADGPLNLAADNPAAQVDESVEPLTDSTFTQTETPATPKGVDPTATDPAAPAGDTTSTSNSASKKTSSANAAS